MMEIAEKILISDKIIWNGPPGVFENKDFQLGTKTLIMSINQSESKIKVAGGGSTIAAINHFGSNKNFTHISTGGGAFLSLLKIRLIVYSLIILLFLCLLFGQGSGKKIKTSSNDFSGKTFSMISTPSPYKR